MKDKAIGSLRVPASYVDYIKIMFLILVKKAEICCILAVSHRDGI